MRINSVGTNTPLLHCYYLDWRGQGCPFQFSPKLKEEAECMIPRIYRFLEHHYLEANVMHHFTIKDFKRNINYIYNAEKGMVINNVNNEEDGRMKNPI